MSWTTSTSDLQVLLSDGDTDRLRNRKRCIGRTNGTNTKFSTLEFRRVSDFTSASAPVAVYVNDSPVAVSADNPTVGEFTLSVAPAANTEVRATYYYRWFTDTELADFVQQAVYWLGPGTDVTQIDARLQPAVLQFAASLAYQKLAIRWTENWSMIFKLEDAPKEPEKVSAGYLQMAKDMRGSAETLRAQFYSRQDQNLQPSWVFLGGRVSDPTPKR